MLLQQRQTKRARSRMSLEEQIKEHLINQLRFIGEDPEREGLKGTPARVLKSWKELYSGYGKDPKDILTVFEKGTYNQIVLLQDVELYSTCEHHMITFYGKAHVAYLPGEKVIGISKLARLVDIYARRLQIQERIGEQVTEALMTYLKPKGAACFIEARHFCMCARGCNKQNSIMKTFSLKGAFLEDPSFENKLLMMIK